MADDGIEPWRKRYDGRHDGSRLREAMDNDRADHSAVKSIIAALCTLHPSDLTLSTFQKRYVDGSTEWELPDMDPSQKGELKFRSFVNSLAYALCEFRDGRNAMAALSILLHGFRSNLVAQIIDDRLDLVWGKESDKPTLSRLEDAVVALEANLSCITWDDELSQAEEAVLEAPRGMTEEEALEFSRLSLVHRDIPSKALAGYIGLLEKVERFPQRYTCELETSHSIVVPYMLAHMYCGLKVCVIIDDRVVQGKRLPGKYNVLLKRNSRDRDSTTWRLVEEIDDPQDLMSTEDRGHERANRISIKGIGKAITINRGLEEVEAFDLAALTLTLVRDILSRLRRDICKYKDDKDRFAKAVERYAQRYARLVGETPETLSKHVVPIETRLETGAIALWWGCDMTVARRLWERSDYMRKAQGDTNYSWNNLTYSNVTMGKLAQFKRLMEDEKKKLSNWTRFPMTRKQYGELMRNLSTQLILIAFLAVGTGQSRIHVRNRVDPGITIVGQAIEKLNNLQALGVDDIMHSWYTWIKGTEPRKDWNRVDAFSADGYLIYRSLFTDISLKADACEAVLIEPGHLVLRNQKWNVVRGSPAVDETVAEDYAEDDAEDDDKDDAETKVELSIICGHPPYQNRLKQQMKKGRPLLPPLKGSLDATGKTVRSCMVVTNETRSGDGWVIDLRLILREGVGKHDKRSGKHDRRPPFSITTSVYDIAQRSWTLRYALNDNRIEGEHEHSKNDDAELNEGEEVVEMTPGEREGKYELNPGIGLILYRAHRNTFGQVACLMSTKSFPGYGLVKGDACLSCCFETALLEGLNFVLD